MNILSMPSNSDARLVGRETYYTYCRYPNAALRHLKIAYIAVETRLRQGTYKPTPLWRSGHGDFGSFGFISLSGECLKALPAGYR